MFQVEKTAQIVGLFLWHCCDTSYTMPYLKLLKLLYFTERKGLLDYGYSITGDKLYSLPHGPILTSTCDLMTGTTKDLKWSKWIRSVADFSLCLARPINNEDYTESFDLLNKIEIDIVDELYKKYKDLSRWEIRDLTHNPDVCPEWSDPHGSATKITLERLFTSNNRTEEEAQAVRAQIEQDDSYQCLMQDMI